jgi:lipopolysaccharide/colanic/teichoic acid biosynthesis glycosyltransferase
MFREQVGRGVEYRKFSRAGWTGPAQLQKGHPNPLGSESLDMQYLERCHTWSGWRLWRYDLGILYRTVRIMLEGQGLKY